MTSPHHSPETQRRHPGLEVLAAFVDGRLSGEEQRRTVQHLSTCETCRDVVAETVHLTAELDADERAGNAPDDEEPSAAGGEVLRPGAHRFRRALPLIGGLLAAALGALLFWTATGGSFLSQGLEPVRIADLSAPLDKAALREHMDQVSAGYTAFDSSPDRGEDDTPVPQTHQQAFRIGLRLAFLDASLRAGDVESATRLTHRLEDDGDLSDPGLTGALILVSGADGLGIRGELEKDADTASALQALHQLDDLLTGALSADHRSPLEFPDWYELGKWTGTALVAAHAGDVKWFDDPDAKEQLHGLRQQEWGDRSDPALATVTGLAVSGPEARDLPLLIAALEHLAKVSSHDDTEALSAPGLPPLSDDVTPPAGVDSSDSSDAPDTPDSPTPDGDAP